MVTFIIFVTGMFAELKLQFYDQYKSVERPTFLYFLHFLRSTNIKNKLTENFYVTVCVCTYERELVCVSIIY